MGNGWLQGMEDDRSGRISSQLRENKMSQHEIHSLSCNGECHNRTLCHKLVRIPSDLSTSFGLSRSPSEFLYRISSAWSPVRSSMRLAP